MVIQTMEDLTNTIIEKMLFDFSMEVDKRFNFYISVKDNLCKEHFYSLFVVDRT
jgi:hypothetical protein